MTVEYLRLYVMSYHSRLSHCDIKRLCGYFAAQPQLFLPFEDLACFGPHSFRFAGKLVCHSQFFWEALLFRLSVRQATKKNVRIPNKLG